jgi:nitrate reductase cytochrome c-type subunit
LINNAFFNHTGFGSYNDSECRGCHGSVLVGLPTTLNFSHSVSKGGGGPDCIGCHGLGGSAGPGRLVNTTAMNSTESLHRNLNSGLVTSLPAENRKCWACHGDGTQPTGHPPNYRTPYRCPDCHVPSSTRNLNFTPQTILTVTQHYWNGTSIKTGAVTSCYDCHNKTEMMQVNVDPDGAATVYGGMNGGNNSSSHYGIKRPDLRTGSSDNCLYCHQNTSTAFTTAMVKPDVSSYIYNHSGNPTFPSCDWCHSTGLIHDSSLSKPNLTIPFCLTCHSGGIGTKKAIPSTHNNTVNCWNCHQDPNGTMARAPPHGMMYPQETGNYLRYIIGTPANCTTCHVYNLVNTTLPATGIPKLNHSNDPSAGQKWGNYWNNTSMISACNFCHQTELHKPTDSLLGNVTNVRGTNSLNNPDLSTSTWCSNCHYKNAPGYNGTSFVTPPPEITNSSLALINNAFFNHTGFGSYNDSECRGCHGSVLVGLPTTLNFSHSVSKGGGGPDCIGCHDINKNGAPENKRVIASALKQGVHRNLNSNASNSSIIDPINKACWTCHGDGKQPEGHPDRYKNPRRCSNDDCHSISQSFKEPMVYSHFKDANLNDNPSNVTNFNVTTKAACESCHSNSLFAQFGTFNASVSHYASREKLIDSMNCIYCHLDKDNAEKWGNAIEINKNRTSMVEMDRLNNKFTARTGDFVDLGLGYRLKVNEVSTVGNSASIDLYNKDILVDYGLVNIGKYVYEENRTIDNTTSKIPIIILNFTAIFISNNVSFVQFEGFRVTRVHSENKTTSCYLCHFNGGVEKHKFTVIDRLDNNVYYSEILFNSSDNKEYDQQTALQILANETPKDDHVNIERPKSKSMREGETWQLSDNYRLTLQGVDVMSASAIFILDAGGISQTDIARQGQTMEYNLRINYLGNTYSNVTIFRANVSEILQPLVILDDIFVLSPDIKTIKDNTTLYGYNTSWLWEKNTFNTGRIPVTMHEPLLQDGKDGGPDCKSCHNVGDLGLHTDINSDASGSVLPADKACWACHGQGKEPKSHPYSYKDPRLCKSCHVKQDIPFYNATYVGDEKHGAQEDCPKCHLVDTHKIIKFDVVPGIKDLSISSKEVASGEIVVINATAIAGFNMSIRGAEYYIDSPDVKYPMSAKDGSFDNQMEELSAGINTSRLNPGVHSIYVRAMERNNKWGPENVITLTVKENELKAGDVGIQQWILAMVESIERFIQKSPFVAAGIFILIAIPIFIMGIFVVKVLKIK